MRFRKCVRKITDQELVFRYDEFLDFVRSQAFEVPLEKHFEIEVLVDQDTPPKRIDFLRGEVLVFRITDVFAVSES